MALRDKFFSDNIKIGNMPCIAFLNFGICPGSLSKEGFDILFRHNRFEFSSRRKHNHSPYPLSRIYFFFQMLIALYLSVVSQFYHITDEVCVRRKI